MAQAINMHASSCETISPLGKKVAGITCKRLHRCETATMNVDHVPETIGFSHLCPGVSFISWQFQSPERSLKKS